MPLGTDDDFQHELIDLFVQEAHEWLQQIHVALDELQQGPPPDRHVKLVETIKAGITNLGGSAATINLHDVEQTSFSAVPFIEAVQNPHAAISVNDFLALCKHLGQIHAALTKATGVSFDAEAGASAAQSESATVGTADLLAAVKRLHETSAGTGPAPRNLALTVIAQIEGLMKNGVGQCQVSSFQEFLDRVAGEEEAFLRTMREQQPALTDAIRQLKARQAASSSTLEEQPALAEQAAQLASAAQQINAAPAIAFFRGLQSFVATVAQRRVAVAMQRFDGVEARLVSVTDAVQAWVEAGRDERAAIGAVLSSCQ